MSVGDRTATRGDRRIAGRPVVERWPLHGLAAALGLMGVGLLVPVVFGWQVHAHSFAPLSALWRPRFGAGTIPALAIGVATVIWAPRLAATLSWSRLLLAMYVASVAWLTSLATVDGWSGIGGVLGRSGEYLHAARHVNSVSIALHAFMSRIPIGGDRSWPTHVAGHPPGALLFFVLLVHLGLGGGLAAGWAVLLIAATTPVAVLFTLRQLGAEVSARHVAPFLTIGPAAIWTAVSADGMFAAVAAWGLCCLAVAVTQRKHASAMVWSAVAGLLLGYCVFLSYGLPLLAVLAVTVAVIARRAWPLIGAAVAAVAVGLAFAAAGYVWWDALPALRARYYAGVASERPAAYWVWADFAALCFSAGPILGAALVASSRGVRLTLRQRNPAVALALAAWICVLLADVSFMSKAETERIWLPFVPWLLLGVARLPDRWCRRGLAIQALFAILVQSLLFTRW